MTDKFTKWLRAGLAQPGKSQASLARYLKVSEPVVSRMVAGTRPLRDVEIDRIAAYFGTRSPLSGTTGHSRLQTVPVLDVAHEGVWREGNTKMHPAIQTIEAMPHPDLPVDTNYYSLQMEHASGETTYMICVPMHQVPRSIRERDLVHVVREGLQGLEQVLIRRVEKRGNKIVLVDASGSNNKEIALDECELRGLVVGSQSIFPL